MRTCLEGLLNESKFRYKRDYSHVQGKELPSELLENLIQRSYMEKKSLNKQTDIEILKDPYYNKNAPWKGGAYLC